MLRRSFLKLLACLVLPLKPTVPTPIADEWPSGTGGAEYDLLAPMIINESSSVWTCVERAQAACGQTTGMKEFAYSGDRP